MQTPDAARGWSGLRLPLADLTAAFAPPANAPARSVKRKREEAAAPAAVAPPPAGCASPAPRATSGSPPLKRRLRELDSLRPFHFDKTGTPPGPKFLAQFAPIDELLRGLSIEPTPSPAAPKACRRVCVSLSPTPSPAFCVVAPPATCAAVQPPTLRSAAAHRASAAPADVAVMGKLGGMPVQKPAAGTRPAAPDASAPVETAGHDLMVSYRKPETGSSKGGDRAVRALCKALRRRGYTVFVAEEAIKGGDSWPATIQKAVQNCKAFVILCSPTYGNAELSRWTERELVLADNLKKPLLPVWHSGPYPPPAVAIYLSGTQRIPAVDDFYEGYVAAGISHEHAADELVTALMEKGIRPSRAPLG